jgi:hypothetical protein
LIGNAQIADRLIDNAQIADRLIDNAQITDRLIAHALIKTAWALAIVRVAARHRRHCHRDR